MIVEVDRGSVAAGDDVLPHARRFDVPPETSLGDVVAGLLERRFLALIAGGRATWILVADRPLAVVAQQWDEPRFLVDASGPISSFGDDGGRVSLMFRYWMQHDPDHVFAELAAGREPRR
ncbi:hypothetical protein [Actinomadura citrea]|uniref:Uncharacterized protein n=1 Tax=Actinomadura citrea TaxID=46158 RepID=A0A7Y9KCS0_9ACTN|nr:hypothetical protein [Actinomadura citrea]NYE12655.1 hypothetical protein [Actinomadura citrea]GGT53505.1 hypothetical protein GCM10010177_07130 [Actinomadura citrea]